MVDDETRSWWDHVTGEALTGPLAGARLPVFGIQIQSVQSALRQDPDLRVLISGPSLHGRLLARLFHWLLNRGPMTRHFPPGFRKTMQSVDPRLPEHERGLGLIGNKEQVFIRTESLTQGLDLDFEGKHLHAALDPDSGVPFAQDAQGQRPLQLWARWYGFSATYPDCKIL